MNTPFFQSVRSIIIKDLQTEFRSRELISAMVLFALLSTLVFSFALELNRLAEKEVVSGVLWVTIVFASILGLNRSLANEHEQGNLDAMMLAPISRTSIYYGKMVGNFLFTLIVGLILIFLLTILFNIRLIYPLLILTLILGILGLTSVGTIIATMTVQTRSSETLLPIAIMPVILPVLLVVIQASNTIIDGEAETGWIGTLLIIDVLYLTLGTLLFEYVIED